MANYSFVEVIKKAHDYAPSLHHNLAKPNSVETGQKDSSKLYDQGPRETGP